MEEKNKNEEILSRRGFFKKATKGVLPIMGVMALGSNLVSCNIFEPDNPDEGGGSDGSGGSSGCGGSCKNYCGGDCTASCQSECKGLSQWKNIQSCGGSCSGFCNTGCKGTCMSTCKGMNR